MARLTGDATCETRITAIHADGTAVVLLRDVSDAGTSGRLEFRADIRTAANFRSLLLTIIVKRSGRQIELRSLTLNP